MFNRRILPKFGGKDRIQRLVPLQKKTLFSPLLPKIELCSKLDCVQTTAITEESKYVLHAKRIIKLYR
jgi:hypothetical protein